MSVTKSFLSMTDITGKEVYRKQLAQVQRQVNFGAVQAVMVIVGVTPIAFLAKACKTFYKRKEYV